MSRETLNIGNLSSDRLIRSSSNPASSYAKKKASFYGVLQIGVEEFECNIRRRLTTIYTTDASLASIVAEFYYKMAMVWNSFSYVYFYCYHYCCCCYYYYYYYYHYVLLLLLLLLLLYCHYCATRHLEINTKIKQYSTKTLKNLTG